MLISVSFGNRESEFFRMKEVLTVHCTQNIHILEEATAKKAKA